MITGDRGSMNKNIMSIEEEGGDASGASLFYTLNADKSSQYTLNGKVKAKHILGTKSGATSGQAP